MSRLLRIKPMSMLSEEARETGEHSLKRTLGALNLVTLGIGAVIGAGIFTLTGQAAALRAGPAVALSFVLAGIYVRICWTLLCGVRIDHSHRGFCIHLRLCDAGRVRGVDHRVGPVPGVCVRRVHRGVRMGWIFQQPAAAISHLYSAATYGHHRNCRWCSITSNGCR